MAVLVLQALAVQGGAPGRAADDEATGPLVARCPAEIHGALHPEHRIADEEGDHLHVMVGIRRRGGNPVADRTGLVDAFLQDLPGLGLLVEHQLIVVFRHVFLALLIPDAHLAEEAFHAEGA